MPTFSLLLKNNAQRVGDIARRLRREKIRDLMNDPQFKQFLVFLFFVFLSLVFWLMQSMQSQREKRFVLPITLVDVPTDVVVTDGLPPHLEFTLHDKGWQLARYAFQTKLVPLQLSFASFDRGGVADHVVVKPGDVVQLLQLQLKPTTRVAGLMPDTLEVYYTRQPHRRLPVKVMGQVGTTPQHYLVQVSAAPDSVDVYALPSVLDTLQWVGTELLDWTNLTDTHTDSVRLVHARGVMVKPEQVYVRASVGYFVEKSVELPIVGKNFPADKVLRAFPSKVRLTFRVGENESARDWKNLFEVGVDYNELVKDKSTKCRPQVTSLPLGVDNVRLQPQVIDYLIEHLPTEP